MYTGIIHNLYPVTKVERKTSLIRYAVSLPQELLDGIELGASVAIDGVCQTVAAIEGAELFFDAMQETLDKTTLRDLAVGQKVGVERSLKWGDEVGGHLMAGHVFGTGQIAAIEGNVFTIRCPSDWMKYILEKGFISVDGASLTVGKVDPTGTFQLHLIPETLQRTALGQKKAGDQVNIEFDPQTKIIVDTLQKMQIPQ